MGHPSGKRTRPPGDAGTSELPLLASFLLDVLAAADPDRIREAISSGEEDKLAQALGTDASDLREILERIGAKLTAGRRSGATPPVAVSMPLDAEQGCCIRALRRAEAELGPLVCHSHPYEGWQRSHPEEPSSADIRHAFRRWSTAVEAANLLLAPSGLG